MQREGQQERRRGVGECRLVDGDGAGEGEKEKVEVGWRAREGRRGIEGSG